MKTIPKLLLAAALSLGTAVGQEANDPSQDADNTGRNKGEANATTPFDQSEQSEHVEMTATIRQMVMEDDNLSALAKNVKIITTEDSQVVLRGPVESMDEKKLIAAHAKKAGAAKVMNQIEVKKDKNSKDQNKDNQNNQ